MNQALSESAIIICLFLVVAIQVMFSHFTKQINNLKEAYLHKDIYDVELRKYVLTDILNKAIQTQDYERCETIKKLLKELK